MISSRSGFLLTALAALSTTVTVLGQQVDGNPAFAGCIKGDYTFPTDAIDISRQDIIDGKGCASACYKEYYEIDSYFKGATSTCICAGYGPPAGTSLDTGTNSAGGCLTSSYESYVTESSFTFVGCYSTYNLVSGGGSTPGEDLKSCFKRARNKVGVAMFPSFFGGGDSICFIPNSSPVTYSNAVDCGNTNMAYIYEHVAGNYIGGPSDYVRKRKRAQFVAAQEAQNSLCPTSLTACAVGTQSDFECIDTNYELESCGGCANGSPGNATVTGVDCTTLPGPTLGGVTCLKGQCIASSCKQGWELVHGLCVEI